jgi:predicted component of type VI protein secretion system
MTESSAPALNPARWHALYVADLCGGVNCPGVHDVDKYSFDDLFGRIPPRLSFSVPNRLGAGPRLLEIELRFSSLKDFAPDALVKRIPVLDGLMRIRTAISRFSRADLSADALRRALIDADLPENMRAAVETLLTPPSRPKQTPAPQTGAPADGEQRDALHNIYSMVDLGDHGANNEQAGDSALGALTDAIAGAEGVGPSMSNVEKAAREIDSLLQKQLEPILHHPDFLACEARWRELRLLVDSMDFRAGMRLSVISCDTDNRIRRMIDDVFRDVWNEGTIGPDMVILGEPSGKTPDELEALEDIAKIGQSAQCLMIAWAGPAFFGQESFANLFQTVGSVRLMLESHGYERWRAFRDRAEAGWLVLATGAACARSAYGPEGLRTKTFAYAETPDGAHRPWLSASATVAAALIRAMGEMARGARDTLHNTPVIDHMPVAPLAHGNGDAVCPEIWSGDQCWELSSAGLMPLRCAPNDVAVGTASTNTAATDERGIAQAALAGRCGRIALEAAARMAGQPPEAIGATIAASIRALFLPDERYADDVATVAAEQRDGAAVYAIRVQAPFAVFGERFSAEVSFQA